MARKRKIKKRVSSQVSSEDEKERKCEAFAEDFIDQVNAEIKQYETATENLIGELKKEMHTTLTSIPEHIRRMTVKEYVELYLNKMNELSEQKNEDEKTNDKISPQPVKGNKTAKKPTTTRKVPRKTRKTSVSTRKKTVYQTPTNKKPFSFKMIEGTPMLTVGGRRPNLLDKPRSLRSEDDIASIQLNMFSDRGSPVNFMGSQLSEEMRRKFAIAFQTVADELGK
uniref:Uncharacterized protein LOC100178363 n=1 Tax=Phallusia mammillata TaxID=59560 RepID=A0A6F9DH08_9ASCI|nr:uncharacterized protein LOC100178363 [Phallusia mammillata]